MIILSISVLSHTLIPLLGEKREEDGDENLALL